MYRKDRGDLGNAIVFAMLVLGSFLFFSNSFLESPTAAVVQEDIILINTGSDEVFATSTSTEKKNSFSTFLKDLSSSNDALTGAAVSGDPGPSITEVSGCGTLTGANLSASGIFGLNASINVSGDCFIIAIDNVILDGNGSEIVGDGSGIGVNITGANNVTIRNFFGIENFSKAIYANDLNNSDINNNTLIGGNGSSFHVIEFNNAINATIDLNSIDATGNLSSGISLYHTNYSNITRNNITVEDGPGVLLGNHTFESSFYNSVNKNNITLKDVDYGNSEGSGIFDFSGYNNITFNTINVSGDSQQALTLAFANFSYIAHNRVEAHGASSIAALYIFSASEGLNFSNNTFYAGQSYAARLISTVNASFLNNSFYTFADNKEALSMDGVNESTFNYNYMNVSNSTILRFGIQNNHNLFVNNTLLSTTTVAARAIIKWGISGASENNTFLNNNMSAPNIMVDLDTSDTLNYLIYNNSFGQVYWHFKTMQVANDDGTYIQLAHGEDIIILNNSITVNSSLGTTDLNGTATNDSNQYTFHQQEDLTSPVAFRNDALCAPCTTPENTSSNGKFSYTFNASSFSNFSVHLNTPPTLNDFFLNTTSAMNYSEDYIIIWINSSDNESSTIAGNFNLYNGSEQVASGSFQNFQTNGLVNVANRTRSEDYGANENWTYEIRLVDGDFTTSWTNASIYFREITSGDHISGNVIFDHDVSTCTGDCMIVSRDNVIIDMNDYSLSGNGSGIAINISDRTNISIVNGSILDYNVSFYIRNSTNINISYLNISGTNYSIIMVDTNKSNITWSKFRNNDLALNLSNSHFNYIYNNLFNNTVNVYDDGDNYYNTSYNCSMSPSTWRNIVWGNCTGGNFWHNYNGLDNGEGSGSYNVTPWNISGDLIGDTDIPYNDTSGNMSFNGAADFYPLIECVENWICQTWSNPSNTCGARVCTDLNDCGSTFNKPATGVVCKSGKGISSSTSSDSELTNKQKRRIAKKISKSVSKGAISRATASQIISALKSGDLSLAANIFKSTKSVGDTGSTTSSGSYAHLSSKQRTSLSITIINNLEDLSVSIVPEIKKGSDIDIQNKDKVVEKLAEQFAAEELQEQLLLYSLLEENKVLPLTVKESSLASIFTSGSSNSLAGAITGEAIIKGTEEKKSISGISYSNQVIKGKLLKPSIADDLEIVAEPGKEVTIEVDVKDGISLKDDSVTIAFTSDGESITEQEIEIPASGIGSALEVHADENTFDLYVVLPKEEDNSFITSIYNIELDIRVVEENSNLLLLPTKYNFFGGASQIFLKNSLKFSEIYGPYTVKNDEGFIFAQQLTYDPELYVNGDYEIHARIYKDNELVGADIFSVALD